MAMKMVKSMGTSLMSLLFGLTLAVNSASADYVIKDGNGTTQTVKAFACTAVAGGTAICPGYTPQDLSGNALGVPSNPFAISFGTGVQLPGFASPPAVNLQDGSGNAIGSTSGALDVSCTNCSGGGAGGSVNINQINGASPSLTNPLWVSPATGASFAVTGTFWPYTLGQQVAGSSVPVVLPAAQIAALTPPTSVGISGALPGFAATPTVNLGTLNGAATQATLASIQTALGSPFQAGGSIGNTAFGANQGTPASVSNAWPEKITDGTNGPVAVKPPSTAPGATDPAAVVALSPNGNQATAANQTGGNQKTQVVDASGNTIGAGFGAYSTASVARPANTTTYGVNTGWNNGTPTFFSFSSACRVNGGQVLIPRIDIWSSANPTTKLSGVLWLFSAVPGTNVSDQATFTIAAADFANLTGSVQGFPFTLGNNQASGAANSGVSLTGATYQAQCASGSTTITGMVEVTNAYIPASGEVLHVGIATSGVN